MEEMEEGGSVRVLALKLACTCVLCSRVRGAGQAAAGVAWTGMGWIACAWPLGAGQRWIWVACARLRGALS